ncbi:hypothetical protein WDW89_14325 [Deltaproteobacteria bacterium TL4]
MPRPIPAFSGVGHVIPTYHKIKDLTQRKYNSLLTLPPLAEQKRIVAKVDQLMALCDDLESQLAQSRKQNETLMQSILHHVFNGKEGEPCPI